MPTVKMHEVGKWGLVVDVAAHELPPEAWSAASNVRFSDIKVSKIKGHSAIFDPPSIVPYAVFPAPQDTTFYWIYCGLTAVYNVQGSTHTVMTRASGAYNAVNNIPWTGGMFGGVLILNNGVDQPQMWLPGAAPNRLSDLTDFSTLYNSARIIRAFKNYLFAFDIVKTSGTRFPYLIAWSHTADPGTVPDSWAIGDATKDAGDNPIMADTPGYILDAMPLGNTFIVYKEDATYGIQHIGGTFIFRIFKMFEQVGMLTHRCVAAMPKGDSHFVVTDDDIIVHNGSTVQRIADKTVRRTLFPQIDQTSIAAAHVVPNYPKREMWFCFPTSGGPAWCDKALIWNWADGTFTYRDLPGIFHSNFGRIDETLDETWDADGDVWDVDSTTWDERAFTNLQRDVMLADTVNTKLMLADNSNQFNGVNFTAYVERTDLAIAGQDRDGKIKLDQESMKLFKRVWIRATGSPFTVKVGSQLVPGGDITWATGVVFTPGTDNYVDVLLSGRLMAIRFESTGNVAWDLEGFDIEVEILGRF